MALVQIRNVPDDVHRRLKARAAMEGLSLSELALREISRSLERPTRAELLARIAARPPAPADIDVVATVRAERDGR